MQKPKCVLLIEFLLPKGIQGTLFVLNLIFLCIIIYTTHFTLIFLYKIVLVLICFDAMYVDIFFDANKI